MRIIYIVILFNFIVNIFSQNYDNSSFINEDINFLNQCIDSINIGYNSIQSKRVYLSKRQAISNLFYYRGDLHKDVLNDINDGMPLSMLSNKYPDSKIAEGQLITNENGTKPSTTEYVNVVIVSLDLFAASIYIDSTKFNQELKNPNEIIIPGLKFETSIKNSVSSIQFKTTYPAKTLPNKYEDKILYHSSILNRLKKYFVNDINSHINSDDFIKITNKSSDAHFLDKIHIKFYYYYYLENYITYENEEENKYLTKILNLFRILHSMYEDKSMSVILELAKDKNLDIYNISLFLHLASKINRLSESTEINKMKIFSSIETFPTELIPKLKK